MHLSFPKCLQYSPIQRVHLHRVFPSCLRPLSYYVQFSEMLLSNYGFLPTTPLRGRVFYVTSFAAMAAVGRFSKIACAAIALSLLASKVFFRTYVLPRFPVKVDAPFLRDVTEKTLDVRLPTDLAHVILSYLAYDFQGVFVQTLRNSDHRSQIYDLVESKELLAVRQTNRILLWCPGNGSCTSLEGDWRFIPSENCFFAANVQKSDLVEIWDLSSETRRAVLRTSRAQISAFDFIQAKNGNFIGIGSRLERTELGHQEAIYSLAMWRSSAAHPVRTIPLNHEFVRDWKVVGNGDLVTVHSRKFVLWGVSADALCPAITLWNPESIEYFSFLDDRYLLAVGRKKVGSDVFHMRKWDFIECRCVGHVTFQNAYSFDDFLPLYTDQGLHFVTATYSLDKITVRAVDGHSLEYSLTREDAWQFEEGYLVCLQSGSLAVCYGDGRLLLWRPGSGEQPKVLQEGGDSEREVMCMREGKKGQLFVGYGDGSVSIWM